MHMSADWCCILATSWSMRGSVVARAHFRSGSTISLFLAFIPSNAEKPVSHSQVDGKGIKSRIAALATLGYQVSISDQ